MDASTVLTFQVNVTRISDFDRHLQQDGTYQTNSSQSDYFTSFTQQIVVADFAFRYNQFEIPDFLISEGQSASPLISMLGNPVRDSLLQGITNPQNGSFAEASFGSSDSQFAFNPTGSHHDGADFTSVEQWTVSTNSAQAQSSAEQKLQTYFSYGNDYDKVLGVPPFVVRTPAQFLTSLAGLQFSFSTEFTSDSYQSVLNEEGYFTTLYDNTYQHGLSGSATLVSIAAAVPEPASWGLMIAGFGLVGGAMRARATGVRYTTA